MADIGLLGVECALRTATAAIAFFSTNLDDLLLLMLFFGRSPRLWRQTVVGQYLGFVFLVLVSFPGFFVGQLPIGTWIRVLGLVPIGFGVRMLMARDVEAHGEDRGLDARPIQGWVVMVAASTIVNGGDNVSVYGVLFGRLSLGALIGTIGLWLGMVGLWCWLAWWLVGRGTGETLPLQGLVPWGLILLGVGILAGMV
jgi:cadmium resistance protein CadD (predicted permease)